jgi:hypothetical protein
MVLYKVIGIVTLAEGGRWQWKAGAALLLVWSAVKSFGFPLSEGAFCGKSAAHSLQPVAVRSSLYAEGGVCWSREGSSESQSVIRSVKCNKLFTSRRTFHNNMNMFILKALKDALQLFYGH